MFENEEDIYQHIGQAMFNVLPEQWEKAYFVFKILAAERAALSEQYYLHEGEVYDFNVDIIDDEYEESACFSAFFALYKMMSCHVPDAPWNKARLMLLPDGQFDIEFKLDQDFEWLKRLDHDGACYESLHSTTIEAIKSWEGLPLDVERRWLK